MFPPFGMVVVSSAIRTIVTSHRHGDVVLNVLLHPPPPPLDDDVVVLLIDEQENGPIVVVFIVVFVVAIETPHDDIHDGWDRPLQSMDRPPTTFHLP